MEAAVAELEGQQSRISCIQCMHCGCSLGLAVTTGLRHRVVSSVSAGCLRSKSRMITRVWLLRLVQL